jgi:hypothetical protein
MGRESGHKNRVKWTNLSEELISEYGANHQIFERILELIRTATP